MIRGVCSEQVNILFSTFLSAGVIFFSSSAECIYSAILLIFFMFFHSFVIQPFVRTKELIR